MSDRDTLTPVLVAKGYMARARQHSERAAANMAAGRLDVATTQAEESLALLEDAARIARRCFPIDPLAFELAELIEDASHNVRAFRIVARLPSMRETL